jgi:hypothetical protein
VDRTEDWFYLLLLASLVVSWVCIGLYSYRSYALARRERAWLRILANLERDQEEKWLRLYAVLEHTIDDILRQLEAALQQDDHVC